MPATELASWLATYDRESPKSGARELAGRAVREARDEVAIPERAALGDPLLGLVVDVHDAEALAVAELPLEVGEQRPDEVAAHVDAGGDGLAERVEVGAHVGGALGILDDVATV